MKKLITAAKSEGQILVQERKRLKGSYETRCHLLSNFTKFSATERREECHSFHIWRSSKVKKQWSQCSGLEAFHLVGPFYLFDDAKQA